jgi:hypothetical protein
MFKNIIFIFFFVDDDITVKTEEVTEMTLRSLEKLV